jgi:Peptidase family C25
MAERIYANGVSGLTGEYLIPPLEAAQLAALAKEVPPESDLSLWLAQMWAKASQPTYGLPWHINAEDVAQAGWAAVFSTDEDSAVKEALEPLIEHRRAQAGAKLKVLDHLPGESWQDWLSRHLTSAGNVDPRRVPYYVMVVGPPSRIPFAFQYLLDVEYAVGRLHFDDPEGYARYAQTVIDYETASSTPHGRSAVFFGTRHPFDPPTQLSAGHLVKPLAEGDPEIEDPWRANPFGYRVTTVLGNDATKATLREILAGTATSGRPALLFSATHGMGGWPSGHPDQRTHHGALLCQDWPGLGTIGPDQYFAATDLPADARLHGLVAFIFACYGGGTPELDEFPEHDIEAGNGRMVPRQIAPEGFVAALPQALLSHPEGGALAVIGHVERAWGYSFATPSGPQLIPFRNVLGRTLVGQPVGHAMRDFNEKYAALSTNLTSLLREAGLGKQVPDEELAGLWTERHDAQNYVLLGDPAARLKVSQGA